MSGRSRGGRAPRVPAEKIVAYMACSVTSPLRIQDYPTADRRNRAVIRWEEADLRCRLAIRRVAQACEGSRPDR